MSEIQFGQSKLTVTDPNQIIREIAAGTYKYRFAFYGKPKSGKSRLADTFPGNLGVVDCDSGASVYGTKRELMEKMGKAFPYERTVITIKEASAENTDAWKQVADAYAYFLKDPKIDGIVFDSWSTISDIMVYEIQRIAGTLGKMPSQPEYGKIKSATKELLHKAFAAGKHIIYIFHEQTEKDEFTGRVWTVPLMVGKIREEIGRYYDEIYHTSVNEGDGKAFKYQMQTKSCSLFTCGSRMDSKIPLENFEPSDLNTLIEKLQAKCKEKVATLPKVEEPGK